MRSPAQRCAPFGVRVPSLQRVEWHAFVNKQPVNAAAFLLALVAFHTREALASRGHSLVVLFSSVDAVAEVRHSGQRTLRCTILLFVPLLCVCSLRHKQVFFFLCIVSSRHSAPPRC